ncbi:MAG: TCR/Tet family MFS transporter [Woeseiaceae bacterium]|nr:TCR/Tet family MFS transporter [Woeseiaceae bacterium]
MARTPGTNAFLFIFITVTLNMIGFGIIMPVMPQLIMDVTGEDLANAAQWGGYLSLVYALMQFVMMPIVGGLSDRFGRKPILLVSLAAYSLDFLLMAVAPVVGVIVIARVLAGAFAATYSTANAYVADITPPNERAARFGLLGAAFGLGFIIGPGIGGLVGEHFGPRAPFFLVAALSGLNFLFGLIVLPETLSRENRRPFDWRRANALGNFKQFAKYPMMLPISIVLFISSIAHWTYPSVWSYFSEEQFGWTPDLIGWSLMFVGLCSAIVQGGLTRIVVPALGERVTAVAGMCIAAAAYLGIALADRGWVIYVVIAISSLAGLAGPALQGIMSRTMPANAQGELQGAIGAISSVSMILGPPLMTQIFAAFSSPGLPFDIGGVVLLPEGAPFYFPGAPFAFASVLELAAVILLFYAFRRIVRPRDVAAEVDIPR